MIDQIISQNKDTEEQIREWDLESLGNTSHIVPAKGIFAFACALHREV